MNFVRASTVGPQLPDDCSDEEKKFLIIQKDLWEIFQAHNLDSGEVALVLQRVIASNIVAHVPEERWEIALDIFVEMTKDLFTYARSNPQVMARNREATSDDSPEDR